MNSTSANKVIRILLIDDLPTALWNARDRSAPAKYPAVTDLAEESPAVRRSELFDLRWIATAGEAREYIDLTRLISRHNPLSLAQEGWIPEIVVIDYSLTQSPETVEQRLSGDEALIERLSPLRALRRLAKSLDLALPHKGEEYSKPVNQDAENYGCFIGGLVLTVFSDHPCAPVTVTFREQDAIAGSHTGFFEWLLSTESCGNLHAAGKANAGLKEITNWGVKRLRQRIEQLDDSNLITLSLDNLFALSEENSAGIDALQIQSRYGLRRLSLNALFIDVPQSGQRKAIADWAQGRLNALLKNTTDNAGLTRAKNEVRTGVNIAKELWDKYDTLRIRRYRLSGLAEKATKASLSKEENAIYETDRAHFDVKAESGKNEVCNNNICTIVEFEKSMPEGSGRSLRWAILFTVLNLYARKLTARTTFKTNTEFSGDVGGLFADLSAEDVFLALCPSPGGEPWMQKSIGDFCGQYIRKYRCSDRPASAHAQPENYGNLCVKMSDLLAGKKWEQNPAVAQNQWSYGLLPGEKYVLRRYALDQHCLTASDGSAFLNAIFS